MTAKLSNKEDFKMARTAMKRLLSLSIFGYCNGFATRNSIEKSLISDSALNSMRCVQRMDVGVQRATAWSRRVRPEHCDGTKPSKHEIVKTKLHLSAKMNIDNVLHPSKGLLTVAYKRGSYLFLSLAIILFLIPDHTATVQLAAKFGGAAGYAMAGGLCHILASANDKDRLSSDTYVRLNLGLLAFSALGVWFVPAEAGFFFRFPPAVALSLILILAQGYGSLLSFLGWRRGVDPTAIKSIEELAQEVKDGTISTLRGLRVENASKALGYRNCLLIVIAGIFSNVMEGNFNFRYRQALNRSWFDVSLNGSAVSRLCMVATMIYSLKDAGERDRLSGTTFIQLNAMIGIWALLVAMGQSIYPLGFAFYRGVEMGAFSGFFLTKAVKSVMQKQQSKKLLDSGSIET